MSTSDAVRPVKADQSGKADKVARVAAACGAANASLTRAFGFLGKRWNGVLIGTMTAGPMGFAELKRAVRGISDSMLSERLAELAAAGLVVRRVDPGPPVAVHYELTESGHALLPALEALTSWADENLPAQDCPGE